MKKYYTITAERCYKCGDFLLKDIFSGEYLHLNGKETGVTCSENNPYAKGLVNIIRSIHCKTCTMKKICKKMKFPVVHIAKPQQIWLRLF